MKNFSWINWIKEDAGSVLVQVLVATAVLGGAGAYYMSTSETNLKLAKGLVQKSNRSVIAAELGQVLSLPNVCQKTIADAAVTVTPDMIVPAILNASGTAMYGPTDKLLGQEIMEFRLKFPPGYVTDGTLKAVSAQLQVKTKLLEDRTDNKASFAAVEKNHHVPVFMILYLNRVVNCVTDDTNSMLDALKNACDQLEGIYNETTLKCERLHGSAGYPFAHVSSFFCNPVSGACPYPHANQTCTGVDSRGVNYDNYYITGYNADGSKICACMPIKACQDPMNYCLGVDLGTNGCIECGVGVNWVAGCNPTSPP